MLGLITISTKYTLFLHIDAYHMKISLIFNFQRIILDKLPIHIFSIYIQTEIVNKKKLYVTSLHLDKRKFSRNMVKL